MGTFALILVGLFAFLAMVAVYALGGYVAGRMRRRSSTSEDEVEARDGIHGLTVWALGMLLTGFVAATQFQPVRGLRVMRRGPRSTQPVLPWAVWPKARVNLPVVSSVALVRLQAARSTG